VDVVFDEVKGNVVGSAPGATGESGDDARPKPANAERALRETLTRLGARRARLEAD
jgi:hypothetical protein